MAGFRESRSLFFGGAFHGGTVEMLNESRRQLLTNVAKAVPLTAVAIATGSSRTVLAAPKGGNSTTALVNGAVTIPNAPAGIFQGTLTLNSVQIINGVLSAVGTLAGNLVDSAGTVLGTVNQTVTSPLQVTGTCTILDLVLGPLHLNLLGLVVDLNQVHLLITAVPGAGNLLGNLLCAVANLLNGGGALSNLLTGLQDLLNQVLGAL
jgi:hypothetical protein